MTYNTLDELLKGYLDWYAGHPNPTESEELDEWKRLVKAYSDAQMNPPEGVVGVGIITYAEQKLLEAQQ